MIKVNEVISDKEIDELKKILKEIPSNNSYK